MLPGLINLDLCWDIQMIGSEFGVKNMKAWLYLALSQWFRLMVWWSREYFLGTFLGPFVPNEHYLNATAYLSIVDDHVHPFITTVYPSSDGYFQQYNALMH